MNDPVFFARSEPISLARLAELSGAVLVAGNAEQPIAGIGPIEHAGIGDVTFIDNPKYIKNLASTSASAVFLSKKLVGRAPETIGVLEAKDAYRAYARAAQYFFPTSVGRRGFVAPSDGQVSAQAFVHPHARLEPNVTVEPGAVIGSGTEIGSGSVVCANAVVGENVRIGRETMVGSGAALQACLIGDNVILHPGVRIGQDGFGFAMGAEGHLKVPQVGRVIIQDDVEIGANTTIDRGTNRDTVIGQGTKIDNLVQIGHNVRIGRHCIVVGLTGISGSATLEDFVVLGGQVGVNGHITIGMGAQIAGTSNVLGDVPPGVRWGGSPARPVRTWMREYAVVKRLAQKGTDDASDQG
ncbi:MAG: UDP-3-O-(3-hydroxymyristoyl)glucosamine N-acyltransferase [Pseudomonadota bacterium]